MAKKTKTSSSAAPSPAASAHPAPENAGSGGGPHSSRKPAKAPTALVVTLRGKPLALGAGQRPPGTCIGRIEPLPADPTGSPESILARALAQGTFTPADGIERIEAVNLAVNPQAIRLDPLTDDD